MKLLVCLIVSLIAPGLAQPSPDNDSRCPVKQPNILGGDSCTLPSGSDCLYRPFIFPGFDQITYIGRCTCFDGTFACAEQSVASTSSDNDPACPSAKPSLGETCKASLIANQDGCFYRIGSSNQISECICTTTNQFLCKAAFTPMADPSNAAQCPAVEPFYEDTCSQTSLACNYRAYNCPSGTRSYVRTYTCNGKIFVASNKQANCGIKFSLCFAGESTVDVEGKGVVPMKQLQIGDKVHVGDNHYESVYGFGHYNQEAQGEFLEVKTNMSTLKVTADHMVYMKSSGFVPASALEIGDTLVEGSSGADMTIQSIRETKAHGVFAPFTPSGKIVVNNVLASSFVSLNSQQDLSIAGFKVSHQWLAHKFEFPHRVACYYMGRCTKDTYSDEGISSWVALPLAMSQWVLEQNPIVRNLFLVLFMGLMTFFATIEMCMLSPMTSIVMFASVAYFYRRNQSQHKVL